MYQRIKMLFSFTLWVPIQINNKAVMLFFVVLCCLLVPSITRAACELQGSWNAVWYCDSQGECSDKLSGAGGEGSWTVSTPGQDCICAMHCSPWEGCYPICGCCAYQIADPPPCQNGDPCCKDRCCGDPCCGKCPCPVPANGHTGG